MTQEEVQAMYLALPVAACLIDRSFTFIAANQKYAELMRTPLESIVGRSMEGLNPVEHINNVQRDFQTFDSGGMVPDHEIELWDGNYLVSVAPIAVGQTAPINTLSVTLVNITAHKRLQATLSGMVGELTLAKEAVDRLAETDALTGLGNRRAFDTALARVLDGKNKASSTIALLILDVDHFKRYNDTYGHLAGDDCLRRIATAIHGSLKRSDDSAARFGGEEFVVILPDTELQDAQKVAENIRINVVELGIVHTGSQHGIVTISIGLAHHVTDTEQDIKEVSRALLGRADTALYAAKMNGRNRVTRQD